MAPSLLLLFLFIPVGKRESSLAADAEGVKALLSEQEPVSMIGAECGSRGTNSIFNLVSGKT